ncbi:MAG TPA: 4Fe-4S binding protein, partial [Clostridia bacterium]|nr:4Fe-4S binding protein [Clostridia bacterium]
MAKLTFESELCKGCGLCVDACPKKILAIDRGKLNRKGHSPAAVTDMALCTGCGSCATM